MLSNKENMLNYNIDVIVTKNTLSLDNQTDEICLNAVMENGFDLQFVKKQTRDICLAAVKQNGLALQFVKYKTDEICLAAMQQNQNAFKYLDNNMIYWLNFV